MAKNIENTVTPVPLGDWRFGGFLGSRIDTLAQARLTSEEAWREIYPETEEAFRRREDDKPHPVRGEWRGEFWGKYMLSAIGACRYYADEELKRRISQAVQGLLSTQDESGYIGTYTDSTFFGPRTWNIWGRKYTLWALLEAWQLLGDENILAAAVRHIDYLMGEVGPGQHDIVQTGQFYGLPSTSILKPVVLLYQASGNPKYLEFARYIVDQWIRHPEGLPDLLRKGLSGEPIHTWFPESEKWAKSYEFVSCVEGLLELYRVTGEKDYLAAVKNIHAAIAEWERTPVGSMSFNDKFIGSRYLINTVSEICDAVYWNRLSFELFLLTKDVRYLEEIELTLYNTLLCGMKPNGTWGLRRLRFTHEHIPAHNHFLKHHQCCVDNLPRGLFQGAESALFTNSTGIYVALYNPGKGKVSLPSGGKAELVLSGDFLNDESVTLTLSPESPETFALHLRIPSWSNSVQVSVNGEEASTGTPGAWLTLEREWKPGDSVSILLHCRLREEYFDPDKISADDPMVAWHEKQWATMGFIGEDHLNITSPHSMRLSLEDALPHRRAVMFFKGPVALARDVRLGDGDVLSPLPEGFDTHGAGELRPIPAPEGIWKAYELDLSPGAGLRLCDFASAGNTWDAHSKFAAWNLLS